MAVAEDPDRKARGGAGAFARGALARLPAFSVPAVTAWLERQMVVEAEARNGFFLVPMGLMLGIALFYAAGFRPPIWAAAAAGLPLLLVAWHAGGRGVVGPGCLLAGFVAAGMALSGLELARTTTTILSGEATVRIAGKVEGREQDDRGRIRYRIAIETTERPTLSRPPEVAEILVTSKHAAIPIGGRYAGLVRLRAPSGPAFPGGYDFGFGNYFDGLGAQGFSLGPPDPPAPDAIPAQQTVGERLLALRLAMSERIRSVVGGAEGAVASALITGDRAGIPDAVELWLRTTGLSHVLSISGLHMALVAGFAMFLVRAGLAAIPAAALHWPIKKFAAVAALAVVTFYILLSGNNVAADRSYIMLSIMLAAILFDRPAITLRNVALAAIVVLAMAPHALLTASFQMSFGATASLVGVYGGVARARAKHAADRPEPGRAVRLVLFLVGLGASSLIAGTATGPYAAYHFQRLAPFGLFANLLALPLFSVWIMPLALIAVVAMPFGLDGPFLQLMGYGLTLVFEIAHFLHDHLPDAPTGLVTDTGLVLLTVALLLACFLASGLRWLALPLSAIGLLLAPDRSVRPELLVFEDGKELALIDSGGGLLPMRAKPNGFVSEQWRRAFPGGVGGGIGFVCEALAPSPAPSETSSGGRKKSPKPMQLCRAATRGGLNIVWTDDFRQIGAACDTADVVIVARAVRVEACRSGAVLMTLRSLRRTGSLAISRSAETGKAVVSRSVAEVPEPWQAHRLAPWPEAWHRPKEPMGDAAPVEKGP